MNETEWKWMVEALIAQGIVKSEQEAELRLACGEKLPFKAKLDTHEWRGLYGSSE